MSIVTVSAVECDGCGHVETEANASEWKRRYYGATSVLMHFCPRCKRAGLDKRLSRGNPYDTEADARRHIATRRSSRNRTGGTQ